MSAADPLAAFRAVNVAATLNLARQATEAGVRRFVFISTIGVNGAETFGRPFTAEDAPRRILRTQSPSTRPRLRCKSWRNGRDWSS